MFEDMSAALYDMMHAFDIPIYAPIGAQKIGAKESNNGKHICQYNSVELAIRALSVMAGFYERKKSVSSLC